MCDQRREALRALVRIADTEYFANKLDRVRRAPRPGRRGADARQGGRGPRLSGSVSAVVQGVLTGQKMTEDDLVEGR
jgi:hypothetical protein